MLALAVHAAGADGHDDLGEAAVGDEIGALVGLDVVEVVGHRDCSFLSWVARARASWTQTPG